MKKKFLLGLVTLGAASMLCGFDSAETVDTLSEKMNAASTAAESMSAAMAMNLDAAVNVSDGTTDSSIALAANGNFNIACLINPFSMKMDGAMKVSSLGQNQDVKMEAYYVTDENGDMKMYIYSEDSATGTGEWQVETEEGFNIDELMALSTENAMSFSDLADWGLVFELAPEAADVDGVECYLLSTTMDSASISTILSKTSELTGEDLTADADVSMALSMLDGLKLNLEYYIDATTYLPVKVHMDMNGSDLSTINQLIAASMASADSEGTTTTELVLNDLSIDMTTSFGAVDPITVPEEALAAEAAGTESAAEAATEVVAG